MPSTNIFNELCAKTRTLNTSIFRVRGQNNTAKIYSEKILTVCYAVYFQLCIDLMHIAPSVTAEGFNVPITRGVANVSCNWWSNMNRIDTQPEIHCITCPRRDFFLGLSRVILTHNSSKTFVEGKSITDTFNVNN